MQSPSYTESHYAIAVLQAYLARTMRSVVSNGLRTCNFMQPCTSTLSGAVATVRWGTEASPQLEPSKSSRHIEATLFKALCCSHLVVADGPSGDDINHVHGLNVALPRRRFRHRAAAPAQGAASPAVRRGHVAAGRRGGGGGVHGVGSAGHLARISAFITSPASAKPMESPP